MILTPRLRLRALSTRDLALFRALYCDAETMRYIGKPLSRSVAAVSLRLTVAATRKPGGLRFYTIVERQSRHALGTCSLRPAAWDKRGVELGIMLVRAARSHGFAHEALRALIDVAFSNLHIHTVWVQHCHVGVGIARLSEALGFRPTRKKCLQKRRSRQIFQLLRRPRINFSNAHKKGNPVKPNIIAFLEQVGRDASMRHANHAALLHAMREEEGRSPAMHCSNQVVKQPTMKSPMKKRRANVTLN